METSGGRVRLGSLEVADDAVERARGLMGRSALPSNGGMVFLFDGPRRDAFWMKDTRIPLSIAFWNRSGRIVDMFDMKPCRQGAPCRPYYSKRPYVGAVEVNRGYLQDRGVRVGDRVDVEFAGG